MIQSGILTTIDSTTGQSTGAPVRGAWINFVQDNVTKATVQTNIETGAYSVDVPFGKYTVKIAVGDVTGIQRAGQLFELKTGDKADAFHKWFYGETGSIDDDLLKQFKQISNDINASANRAESAEKGAKQIETNMQNNSIGDVDGSWLKEGAGGILGSTIRNTKISGNRRSGLYTSSDAIEEVKFFPNDFNYNILLLGYQHDRMSGIAFNPVGHFAYTYVSNNKSFSMIYNEHTAKKDKNGVLHGTTGTPKDTLLVGDYGLGGLRVFNSSENIRDAKLYPQGISSISSLTSATGKPKNTNGTALISKYTDAWMSMLYFRDNGTLYHTSRSRDVDLDWFEIYSEKNTTVDSNGFIKKASPIIKLFDDHIEWNQDFKEDPIFEKIAAGIYKISNTHGLAREGWTYEKPRGKDGNTYFKIKVQKLDDGCIISVHDYFVDYEDVTIIDDVGNKRTVKKQIEVLSQARDIKPEERWIDLRFFEKIYDLTNEPPKINIPYHPLWGIEPYIPPAPEQIEEDIAL